MKQPTSSLSALWSVFWRALLLLPLVGLLFPLLYLAAYGPFVVAVACWMAGLRIEGLVAVAGGLWLHILLRPALRAAWADEYWLGGRGCANV